MLRKGPFGLLWLLALCCAALWASAPAQARPVTDARGARLQLARSPQRVVSLLPALTESICALGQCQRLVGVDRYSNYPDSVQRLPQLGSGLEPNIEAIVALRPDVVLLATSSRASQRLASLGIAVLALEPKNYVDVEHTLHTLATLLDLPAGQADSVWRTLQAEVAQAAQSLPPAARQAKVYVEVGQGPYAASASSFIGETLTRLGVRNVVPGTWGPFPRLNPEFVLRAQPDVLMLVGAPDLLAQYPGWQTLPAVRGQRICSFGSAVADAMVRAGPRMGEAARAMANCLQRHWP